MFENTATFTESWSMIYIDPWNETMNTSTSDSQSFEQVTQLDLSQESNQTSAVYSQPIKAVSQIVIQSFVLVTGVIGTFANGLVMKSMLSKKSKTKSVNAFVINQLALDLFASLSVILVYSWKLSNIKLYGTLNVVTCILIGSEDFV